MRLDRGALALDRDGEDDAICLSGPRSDEAGGPNGALSVLEEGERGGLDDEPGAVGSGEEAARGGLAAVAAAARSSQSVPVSTAAAMRARRWAWCALPVRRVRLRWAVAMSRIAFMPPTWTARKRSAPAENQG